MASVFARPALRVHRFGKGGARARPPVAAGPSKGAGDDCAGGRPRPYRLPAPRWRPARRIAAAGPTCRVRITEAREAIAGTLRRNGLRRLAGDMIAPAVRRGRDTPSHSRARHSGGAGPVDPSSVTGAMNRSGLHPQPKHATVRGD